MRLIFALLWGAILGAASTFVHNALFPWGEMLALLGTGLGIWLVGRMWGWRFYKAVAALGWLLVIVRASMPGIGGELLIEGNVAGNLFVIGGAVVAVLAAFLRSN